MNDRPNTQMRDMIEAAIDRLETVGRHRLAAELHGQGVPIRVIVRVLQEPGQRRALSPS